MNSFYLPVSALHSLVDKAATVIQAGRIQSVSAEMSTGLLAKGLADRVLKSKILTVIESRDCVHIPCIALEHIQIRSFVCVCFLIGLRAN